MTQEAADELQKVIAERQDVNFRSIELDCAPGMTRPGDLLPGVIDGLGLTLDPKKPESQFFGNWEWVIPDDQREQYNKVRDTVKERVKRLYNAGAIRYGSW